MTKSLEFLVATSNAGKVREIQRALAGLPVALRSLPELGNTSAVAEIGQTYEENAALKAEGYAKQTGLMALADDSGLEVDALGGQPGVHTARYGGDGASDLDRINKLLRALEGKADRAARFVCCVAIASADARVIHTTRGECYGVIADRPAGDGGFGYDPVFIPNGYNSTFAELPDNVKQKISHRARALAAMKTFLESWIQS